MKYLKIKLGLFSLLAILAVSVFLTSCEQEAVTQTETDLPNFNFESTTTELAQDDPIILALKASEDLQHYNEEAGELLWDMATMISYDSEETLPFIIIPIDNGGEEAVSMLVSAYNEEKGEFHSFLNDVGLSGLATAEEGYTGTIEFKTVENLSVQRTVYEKGNVLEIQEFEIGEIAYRGVDVGCFLKCAGPNTLGSIGLCQGAVTCCLGFVSPWNPCCVTTAGCALWAGGYAGYCAWKCWD